MPTNTTFAGQILALFFQGTAITGLAQNNSSPYTTLYLALHNSTGPGVGGSQTTNETAYTNYARVAVNRNSGGWTIASNQVSNAALTQFAQCGASGDTLTYVSIGSASSGAGQVYWEGALGSSLAVSNLIQPQFAIGTLVLTVS